MEQTQTHEDQRIVRGLAANDSAIVREVYTQYLGRIVAFVEQNSGLESDARDLFQEALIVLFNKARTGSFELQSSFYTYFYAVCRNLWLKKLRKKGRHEVTLEEEMVSIEEASIDSSLLKEERMRLYRTKFLQLGQDCQQLLQLFFEGVSMLDIASKMGFSSEGYAKKRKFQCKQKLTVLIESDPNYTELLYE